MHRQVSRVFSSRTATNVRHIQTTTTPLSAAAAATATTTTASTKASLPTLPYSYQALEPYISGHIMELHHSKHHQAYVNNYNAAIESYRVAEEKNNITEMINLQGAIKFNGGGHVNHSIFWQNLAPTKEGGGAPPQGDLLQAINTTFGSLDKFVTSFNAQTAAVQGSGWGWLVYNKGTNGIQIMTTSNQDPITGQFVPLLGIDVWEHAYYLQYKNVRPDYLKAVWNVVNWRDVAQRFEAAKKK